MKIVSVQNIQKSYNNGKILAVKDVSFEVDSGEIFGLIGPDGSGKTSIFRMLATLLVPDNGKAQVNNFDIIVDYKSIRKSIGYMPGKFSLYQDLTVEENLNFFATLFNTSIEENYALIEKIYVQIEPFKNRRAGKLSGGMKQKLALCCALIHKPSVLFLDEPTTGVDAVSRKEFWEMLKHLKQKGITILVSTPYMDEATLCDRIALIQNGRILQINEPKKIMQSYPNALIGVKAQQMSSLLKDLRTYPSMINCFAFGEYIHVAFEKQSSKILENLMQFLVDHGHQNIEMLTVEPSIEDCFIQLMDS